MRRAACVFASRRLTDSHACRLQRLLEAEQIPHKVKTVVDYRNLGDIYVQHIAGSTEAREPRGPEPLAWWSRRGVARATSLLTCPLHTPRSCEASCCSTVAASSI